MSLGQVLALAPLAITRLATGPRKQDIALTRQVSFGQLLLAMESARRCVLICQKKGGKNSRLAQLVISINNWRVNRSKARIKPENALLLLPRCLQFSDCPHNVTKDITNCKGCGRCKIKDLVQLAQELKVKAFVATGGRIALSKVQEPWVQGVVAIACGAELKAGILSSAKPVLAIENLRPCGPCTDTDVDMALVRNGMLRFLGYNEHEHP